MAENNKEKINSSPKSEQALREEKILEFWQKEKIFSKTLKNTEGKKEFVFYDGPPTANGMPGIHHLIPQSFKDAIPRYKIMRGYHVRRKGGWDTHGLPVELLVEKELGLKSKKEIESYGIAQFNQKCKESVWKHVDVWYKYRDRVGYWVDKDNPYVTYDNTYIESLWNVVSKINDQKLLYKDYKVVPWCPRCGTALSSHELAQGYEDVKDLSVYVKFKVIEQDDTYILAWTTTPWTLPGNVALAVGEDIEYVKIEQNNEFLILAKKRLEIIEGEYKIVHEMTGRELLGLEYEPLFPFLKHQLEEKPESTEKMFKLYGADFVNTEDGTGIVHTAVMYGQDDFVLGTKIGLPKYHLVNPEGNFVSGTGFLEGRFVKETNADGKPTLTVDIIEDLKRRSLFFKQENYKHSYPHCWRCKTALIYYARDSWYIRMSDPKIKQELISQNQKINWEPSHIRNGRFGEWLREIKDWAISRERYWGTPLPVWDCELCNNRVVISSVEELQNKTKKSGNEYYVMRHGESESNVKGGLHGTVSSRAENEDHLTKNGIEQVKKSAKEMRVKGLSFDLVVVSPFMRTRETLEILKKELGIDDNKIFVERRLGELNTAEFNGKSWDEYRDMFKDERDRFLNPIAGGESLLDVKRRVGDVFYELDEKYHDKKILVVAHGGPIWMLHTVMRGLNVDESIAMTDGLFRHSEVVEEGASEKTALFKNAQYEKIDFIKIPHNKDYEIDLHRPYIDDIKLACTHSTGSGEVCGGELVRTKEVMDVWFDSGAMPFAQDHYPFENKEWVEGAGFPADYISEAIDQTRGWFYTLHAVGVLMGRGLAYKNVICLGHLLDSKGKKMSKSLGNIVDPWIMMDKYGVDTIRLWMYSINQPGEAKNFDEKTVALVSAQVFGLLYNVLAFYELYRDKNLEKNERPKPENILDQWILARLDELIELITNHLDSYKLLEPVRAIRDFVGDLSTWYLRRSRERIKEVNTKDSIEAKQTLYFVLKTLSKLLAPFAPFTAEDIWLRLKINSSLSQDAESVHLENWPKKKFKFFFFSKPAVLEKMETVRNMVTLGLDARQQAGIKVRQPLGTLDVIAEDLPKEYLDIVKEELNIKNINYLLKIKIGITKVTLDTNITPLLKQEGEYRELVRALQEARKKMGLTPRDMVSLTLETSTEGEKLIQKFEADIKKTVQASKIDFKPNQGEEIKVENLVFKVEIVKI